MQETYNIIFIAFAITFLISFALGYIYYVEFEEEDNTTVNGSDVI